MQVGLNGPNMAADQISRSVQMMNDLNQKIVDAHQETSAKLIGMSAEAKVAQNEMDVKGSAINMLA